MNQTGSQPFMLPSGVPLTAWKKVVDLEVEADLSRAGEVMHTKPPMSAARFHELVGGKWVRDESHRALLSKAYRKVLEEGYSGVDTLRYTKLDWNDDELATVAATLSQVSCPNVTELDLSWNHFSVAGLASLGEAVSAGSLHGLKALNLSNCMCVASLPPTLGQLAELETLDLSGCVGLSNLPPEFTQLVSLREINVKNCHLLRESGFEKRLPKATHILRDVDEPFSQA